MTPVRKLFGTDGIRGPANVEPMTAETALRLGQAAVQLFRRQSTRRPALVIGKDTRLSGGMIEAALAAGASSMGADVWLAGVLPTPAIALLTRSLQADAGVVVSASHNPFADNGIKFFGPDGFKLPDSVESEIEALLQGAIDPARLLTGGAIGNVRILPDANERYMNALQAVLPDTMRLQRFKIVIDCANGAGFRVAPALFAALGAQVSTLGTEPDGTNINDRLGAVHPQQLQEAVVAAGADMGLALDGDADRAILVDASGAVVDGDEVMAMLGVEMHARGTLRGAAVVATVMSNLGLEIALREHGIRLLRAQVGDRYVVEEMRRGGYNLGGEQSGHLLFLDSSTTGDGIIAALQVARLMTEKRRPLSELKRVMSKLPQVMLNVRVSERRELDAVAVVRDAIAAATAGLKDRGRVLVRYSGTEPLVRVMVEGDDAEKAKAYAEQIAAAIRTSFGA